MQRQVKELEAALAIVRARLLAADVTAQGFGEVRSLYNDLTDSLIRVAHRSDQEIADRLNATVTEIADEWTSNKAGLGGWSVALKGVVDAVGGVLSVFGHSNPLASLLTDSGREV